MNLISNIYGNTGSGSKKKSVMYYHSYLVVYLPPDSLILIKPCVIFFFWNHKFVVYNFNQLWIALILTLSKKSRPLVQGVILSINLGFISLNKLEIL